VGVVVMDAIIAIGQNGSHDPESFATGVRGIIIGHGQLNAEMTGTSTDEIWGSEPAIWFAATFRNLQAYTLAKYSIKSLAAEHNQDAVAFTVGTTEVMPTGIKEAI
jgi:hypothetical protein